MSRLSTAFGANMSRRVDLAAGEGKSTRVD